jgi:hypothetical protein
MIKRYNNLSFVFGIPGLVLQVVCRFMLHEQPGSLLALLIGVVGTVLLLIGFAYYAKAKGRHPAWCLMAFLSCFGLIALALLKDKSNPGVAARQSSQRTSPQPITSSQVTTHERPFVIQNPAIGFLNLQGARGADLLESDRRVLSPLFAECRTSEGDVPPCQVLFIYCDVESSGRIPGTAESLRGLAKSAGAYIVVVATENRVDAYNKALQPRVDWNANLVMALNRKGDVFASFFRRLFEKMHEGTSMLTAWVEFAPQNPNNDDPNLPESAMIAEAGHVTFGKT